MAQVYWLNDSSYNGDGDRIFEGLFFAAPERAAATLETIYLNNQYENWAGYELRHGEDGEPYIYSEHRAIEICSADLITD